MLLKWFPINPVILSNTLPCWLKGLWYQLIIHENQHINLENSKNPFENMN